MSDIPTVASSYAAPDAGRKGTPWRVARCSCGQLTAKVRGEPLRVAVCHCLACQRRTGSVFGVQARFHEADVEVDGPGRTCVRVGDEGGRCRFVFCPECGATVCYMPEGLPGFVAIPVGAFADPTFPPPAISIYEERQHPWVAMPAGIEHLD